MLFAALHEDITFRVLRSILYSQVLKLGGTTLYHFHHVSCHKRTQQDLCNTMLATSRPTISSSGSSFFFSIPRPIPTLQPSPVRRITPVVIHHQTSQSISNPTQLLSPVDKMSNTAPAPVVAPKPAIVWTKGDIECCKCKKVLNKANKLYSLQCACGHNRCKTCLMH